MTYIDYTWCFNTAREYFIAYDSLAMIHRNKDMMFLTCIYELSFKNKTIPRISSFLIQTG